MTYRVLIAHAPGEEKFAENLAGPIRAAGYEVAHQGTAMVGESIMEEASKVLGAGGPVVLCGTVRALGTGWAHRFVHAARYSGHGRIFVVQMQRDAYVEPLSLDGVVARYWQDPHKAMTDLLASIGKHYPLDAEPNIASINQGSGDARPKAEEPSGPGTSTEQKTGSSTEKKMGTASAAASVIGFLFAVITLGMQIPTWIRVACFVFAALGFGFYLFSERSLLRLLPRRLWHGAQRLRFTISGASKKEVVIDFLRLVGIAGLVTIPLFSHGKSLFSYPGGIVFALCMACVIFHILYGNFGQPSLWDTTYKRRKSMVTLATNYASFCFDRIADKDEIKNAINKEELEEVRNAINNIELNALMCIKSYLEYSVMDRDGNNFDANLVVRDPRDMSKLVCIQRVNPGKQIPKFYPVDTVPTLMKAFNANIPNYVGDFKSLVKDYKMVWHIPITFPPESDECVGVLAIDSLKRRHLNLADGRESLKFNLSPYISLLRYSLLMRKKYDIWYW